MLCFNKTLTASILLLLGLAASSSAISAPRIPPPPQLAATSYILIDFDSGKVLAEKNSNQRLEPASITKIMTAYTVMQEIKKGNIALSDKLLSAIRHGVWVVRACS